jgi:hypothetical protein
MPIPAAKNTEFYSMEMDDKVDAILFRWKKFASGQEFREGMNSLLEYARSKNVSKFIADTSGIKAHREEDEEWLEKEWIPKATDAGLHYCAAVPPESTIAEMDMEGFIATRLDDHDYVLKMTSSMEEAREWIAEK